MSKGKDYGTAITEEVFRSQCLKDKNGEIMTKTAETKTGFLAMCTKIIVVLSIFYWFVFFVFPEETREGISDDEGAIWMLSITLVYMLTIILFKLTRYKEYYLGNEGIVEKRGFGKKIVIAYEELAHSIEKWRPIVYKGKIYFATERKLVKICYGDMAGGVAFCMLILKTFKENTISMEDFRIMFQPGHWKEKREAKKELKKRKQYIRGNQK